MLLMPSFARNVSTLILAALALAAANCAHATEIVIRRHATIEDVPFVRLADIAVIDAVDADVTRQLEGVVLGPAPARRGTVTADQVRDRLVRSHLLSVETSISGASHCEVVRAVTADAQHVPSMPKVLSRRDREEARTRLENVVQERLAFAFPNDGPFKVAVELNDLTARTVLESESPILIRGGTADLSQPQALEIVGDSASRFIATVTKVPVVAVAAVPLSAGVVVQAHHIAFEPRDETGLSDPAMLIGKKLTRPIAAGNVVRRQDVRKVIQVRPNNLVKVWARGPGFAVHRVMKSRGEGAVGDVVAFVSLDGEQQVLATVKGPSDAEIPSASTEPRRLPPMGEAATARTRGVSERAFDSARRIPAEGGTR